MADKNTLFRNKPYDNVRLIYTTFISGVETDYYAEASGNRFYYSILGSTASSDMESATFKSFISITMSNYKVYTFDAIPMEPGETVLIESTAIGMNSSGSKAFISKTFGGFRHSGSEIKIIGGTSAFTYSVHKDFTGCDFEWFPNATQSIQFNVVGQNSETIDWDIHIEYTKGFHSISSGSQLPKPIYPPAEK
jgi:hypothetical protein